jgi:glycosyltransferase involved in cell wall biosynthesis
MTPEVSLLMAVWMPVDLWLRDAVEAALGQDDCSLELLVVDDGSEMPVAAMLADVRDERLHVIRIEHAGLSRARNVGISHARGRWLRFLDADDVIEGGSTARLLRLVRGHDDVIAYGGTVVCDSSLKPLRTISSSLSGNARDQCLLGRFHVRHESMLFPRQVVEVVGGWDEQLDVSADWDFTLRALDHATVSADPGLATFYRHNPASASRGAGIGRGEAARRRIVERFFDRHPDERGTRLERRAYAELYVDRALAYAHVGQVSLALDRIAQAARYEPLRALAATPRLLRLGAGARTRRRG